MRGRHWSLNCSFLKEYWSPGRKHCLFYHLCQWFERKYTRYRWDWYMLHCINWYTLYTFMLVYEGLDHYPRISGEYKIIFLFYKKIQPIKEAMVAQWLAHISAVHVTWPGPEFYFVTRQSWTKIDLGSQVCPDHGLQYIGLHVDGEIIVFLIC